jgi:hypothetical protein
VTLAPDLAATLVAVAGAMGAAAGEWWIIAGAAVALHGGAPIAVGDIDVLFSPVDAALVTALPGLRRKANGDSPRFRSDFYASAEMGGMTVEFMAGFRVLADGDWRMVRPATREPVRVGNATLFVPGRAELIAMLKLFGRDKDRQRIALLA